MDAGIRSAGADDGDRAAPRCGPGPSSSRPCTETPSAWRCQPTKAGPVVGDDELQRPGLSSSPARRNLPHCREPRARLTSRAEPRSGATRAWQSAGPGRRAGRPRGRRSASDNVEQRVERDVERRLSAASVHHGDGRQHLRAGCRRHLDRLARGPARRDDVLDHDTRSASARLKPRRRRRRRPRARRRSRARRAARATSCPMIRPPSAGERIVVGRRSRTRSAERAAERLGVSGMLQHERALQVARAVQSRRQPEMSFEQRGGAAEQVEQFVTSHAGAPQSSPDAGP